jgi:glyoxylase-like metal-dependent hydrolase (beta-lactamase superfamily II)
VAAEAEAMGEDAGAGMIEISEFEEVTRFRMSLEVEGKPVYWVASYLVDGLLIDTGCRHTAEELAGALEGRDLRMVVNTHFHEDHVGADRLLQERRAVPIFAHKDSVERINVLPELHPYQEFVWGYPEPASVQTLGEVVVTDRFRFDVVETPGHSEGHVALLERERGWCFSGDIFITEKPRVLRADEDANVLTETMRMLASQPVERLVLFTSMGEIIPDGKKALLSCADYLEGVREQVKGLEAEGRTPLEIRQEIFGEGSSLAAVTGGHFSSDNLVASLLRG